MLVNNTDHHHKLHQYVKHISDEFFDEPHEQASAYASFSAAAAAVAPPPVNLFPPQGAPLPGAVSAGGGITPAVALSVNISINGEIDQG